MKQLANNRLLEMGMTAIIITIVAAVACGASPAKKTDKSPLAPVTYDPRVSLAPLVEKVAPAVVNISTKAKPRNMPGFGGGNLFEWFFGPGMRPGPHQNQMPKQRSLGSGFIIDSKGLVVTNNHVVKGADEIEVQLSDERKFKAELVGADERTDVALLRIQGAKNLPTVSFGNSGKLKVGDHVVAIGNPFGLDHTVTSGIVSAKERIIGAGPYDDFIQTDASINPGNSGGPLFNLSGKVIGINTAINPQGQGIGFAIPSDLASSIIDSLNNNGSVVRGWLGISFQPLTKDLAKAFGISEDKGAVISNVNSGSPAEKGGLKAGDVIISVNGKKLSNSRQLPVLIAKSKPNTMVSMQIVRNGKKQTKKIKLGKMPEDDKKASLEKKNTDTELGFNIDELNETTKRQLGATDIEGVVISNVKPDSSAAGILHKGDIILEINRKSTRNITEFNQAVKNLKSGQRIILRVFRQGSWAWLAFQL